MKVFRIDRQEKEPIHFYTITALRAYLQRHPEIIEIVREWWARNDLIEESIYTRDEIFTKKAKALSQGETAQWAADHGRF
jgi:hypothetical protein